MQQQQQVPQGPFKICNIQLNVATENDAETNKQQVHKKMLPKLLNKRKEERIAISPCQVADDEAQTP